MFLVGIIDRRDSHELPMRGSKFIIFIMRTCFLLIGAFGLTILLLNTRFVDHGQWDTNSGRSRKVTTWLGIYTAFEPEEATLLSSWLAENPAESNWVDVWRELPPGLYGHSYDRPLEWKLKELEEYTLDPVVEQIQLSEIKRSLARQVLDRLREDGDLHSVYVDLYDFGSMLSMQWLVAETEGPPWVMGDFSLDHVSTRKERFEREFFESRE